MKRTLKAVRKIIVALIGFPVLIFGIILIPLPGPGILVCIAGLFILALEFEWAERHLKRARLALEKIISKARDKKKG